MSKFHSRIDKVDSRKLKGKRRCGSSFLYFMTSVEYCTFFDTTHTLCCGICPCIAQRLFCSNLYSATLTPPSDYLQAVSDT